MSALNRVIKTLIFSDFLIHSGWGLIGPIFAIFITEQIQGGSLVTVGFIAATYWFSKSAVQSFIAHFLDVKKGEGDDFKFLIYGLFLANLVPLAYIFSTQLWHVFLLEIIRGVCWACAGPSWLGIFTRHIDEGWEAFSWSIESTGVGFAAAFAAAFGGILAGILGFKAVFFLVGVFGLTASFFLFLIRNQLFLAKEQPEAKMPAKEKTESRF